MSDFAHSEGVAALILAADVFADGDTPIALGRWGQSTVVEHLVAIVADVLAPVVVVLGSDADRVVDIVDLGDAIVVIDPEWQEGVASPLRAGLDTLTREPGVEHVAVVDAAVPQLDSLVLHELLAAHAGEPHALQGRRIGDGSATVAKYRYARSGPVVLARDLWERFLGMEGSGSIHQALAAHPDWINEVWLDRLPPAEIATLDDLALIAPRR